MTLDGFITFLGLVAAALAIVSPVTRLQLGMAARRLAWSSVLFTAAILYFEFFDLLALGCPDLLGTACPVLTKDGAITPQQAAFLVVFVWLVLLAEILRRPSTSLSSLVALERLVARLAESARYAELVEVVERPIGFIDDCAAGELGFQRRRSRLLGAPAIPRLQIRLGGEELEPNPVRSTGIATFLTTVKRTYVALLPSDAQPREAAERILQTVLRSGSVVDWIAEHRPHFGARLLSLRSHKVGDFSDRFLGNLIAHPGSALYDEVQDNQNLDRCGYVLTGHNKVLRALLTDAALAERLEAYRPIGEHVLGVLSATNAPEYVTTLNLPFDNHWNERGRWRDQTFVAIRYFDILVQASACQNIHWHMWLYYLAHFVERLETFYEEPINDDGFGEFPTRGARLIYAAVDALADFVVLAGKVGEGSNHRAPENDRVDHENGNIPKSAALALGICMRTIILSDRISERVQRTLVGVALSPLSDPYLREGHDRLRKVLIGSIIAGGIVGGGAPYLARLRELYAQRDRPWLDDLDDFRTALAAA
ncbi:hypothetical protein ACFO0A_13020 [Novosphingobium tardum]|uniref:Uncharacterized protein n=1 Tax=Novosphingobium tardum TaxID=1538021 RepID=A0ABV8RUE1_9SPHN